MEKQIKVKQVINYIYSLFILINIVREKSRFIVSLLENPQKLKEERKKYAGWKDRIQGVGKGVSSSDYSSSSYGSIGGGKYGATSSDYYDEGSHSSNTKKNEKEEKSDSEEEEEEDEEPKPKKPEHPKKVPKKVEEEESSEEEEEENQNKNINKNNNKNQRVLIKLGKK